MNYQRSLKFLLLFIVINSALPAFSQLGKKQWADSVLASLTHDERIAQLIVIRTSSMDAQGRPLMFTEQSKSLVEQYNVGAVCLFQGTPYQQAELLNMLQPAAKTPVMVTIDAEWGLGMRFAGVKSFPYQLTLGALNDAELVYATGKAIADQCRRMNIHVNYAPVVDINNNASNPVIGVRSFGEDKFKVALMGRRMMQGMQHHGIMACAKHFPGHGDVSVDSHYDLPLIYKDRQQLNDLELYPFKTLFDAGVGSVMVAHLSIPAIDSTPNQPTSLSPKNILGLMRNELQYDGLTFTDALEMKGVAKFYPGGEAAVQSLIAGNDMLCLPEDVGNTIKSVNDAIAAGRLKAEDITEKCRRVLLSKYDYVFGKSGNIDTTNLLNDLNKEVDVIRNKVALKAFTALKGDSRYAHPLTASAAYVMLGGNTDDEFATQLTKQEVKVYSLPLQATPAQADSLLAKITADSSKRLIVGLHAYPRSAARNFTLGVGLQNFIANAARGFDVSQLMIFGNPYALGLLQHQDYKGIAIVYEDDAVFRDVAYQWLQGNFKAQGTLPVTVGSFAVHSNIKEEEETHAFATSLNTNAVDEIDAIAAEAIRQQAAPGCVVAVLHNGQTIFKKAYGNLGYNINLPVTTETIFDLASVTKISATTVSVMRLFDEKRIALNDTIGKFLPWLRGSDKSSLLVKNLLLHQAGLNAFIPFFREADALQRSKKRIIFSNSDTGAYKLPVSATVYMDTAWADTMYSRIATSALVTNKLNYVYSDNDFILLGKIVEAVTGMSLNDYAAQTFYEPLGMQHTGFLAADRFALNTIAPTESDNYFRYEMVWGYVHDPGAAMFGNIAGHAGLFSNATDLGRLYQMLLNGGHYNGRSYLKKSTIDYFTAYQTPISHRGLGFDKPHKNNDSTAQHKPYPATFVSPSTYGHTGFTGTCIWADPQHNLLYIFLSNRVHTNGENRKLLDLNIRGRIHDAVYKGLGLANQ